eukprot:Anaeramoba_ignava/a500573_13.p1 GENE.a500573_13~~a500573_13.p1  ORF type:complete len:145 (-),score=46.89 a500573_13:45-479(-)
MRGNRYDGIVNYVDFGTLGKDVFELLTGQTPDIFTDELFSQGLNFQKRFYPQNDAHNRSGTNYWPMKHSEDYPMKIYISPAVQNSSYYSLKIDYDVYGNNAIEVAPLLDEIRQIPNTNLFVGKMYFRVLDEPIFILWFSLEKRN